MENLDWLKNLGTFAAGLVAVVGYLSRRDTKYMNFWSERLKEAVSGQHSVGELSNRVKQLEDADKEHTKAITELTTSVNTRLDQIYTALIHLQGKQ